jgi:hypothetical protein
VSTLAENGLAIVLDDNGKPGYINAKGEWVIPPKFASVSSFTTNGLAKAEDDNGKQGFINAKGEWGIPPKFASVSSFTANGLAKAEDDNGKQGFINAKGEWVIPPKFASVSSFTANGLTDAEDGNGRYGFINAKGEWIIPPKFKLTFGFAANGLAGAKDDNGKWGYINAKGEWVIPPKFASAYSFDANGLASVQFKEDDPTRQYIDSTGRSVVPIALPAPASMKMRAVADTREVLNTRGDVVLVIAQVCGAEVSKNLNDEITWPKKSTAQICEESKRSLPGGKASAGCQNLEGALPPQTPPAGESIPCTPQFQMAGEPRETSGESPEN